MDKIITILKICSKCLEEKEIDLFNKAKTGKYGVRGDCKLCQKKDNDIYAVNNRILINEKSRLKYDKNYHLEYRKNNIEKRRIYINNRLKNDFIFKLSSNLKNLIRITFKRNNINKNYKSNIILGCSIEDFKKHLESKFESWMTWDNYGNWGGIPNELNTAWDIDHIIPTSTAKSEDELIKLNHYTNLQPLCSYTNRFIKKNKIN